MQRILIIIGIVLAFLLLAGGVYYFVFQEDMPENTSPNDPFGNTSGTDRDINAIEDDFEIEEDPQAPTGRLTHLYEEPIAGAHIYTEEVFIGTSTEETELVQKIAYIDKQTGHVYTYELETGRETRISNTTFPGIQEVFWFEGADEMILRYTNDAGLMETYAAEVTENGLAGSFLEQGIREVITNRNGELLRIEDTPSGVSGILSNPDGAESDTIFSLDARSVIPTSFTSSFVGLFSAPSATLEGVLYMINTVTGARSRIIGEISGLTALIHPGGNYVLFSNSIQNSFEFFVHNREEGETLELPVVTLPEKCVWEDTVPVAYCMVPEILPPGAYPDVWYRGQVQFNDALWRIDMRTQTARALTFFEEDIDGINLRIDAESEYLIFTNKRDGSLWGFDL